MAETIEPTTDATYYRNKWINAQQENDNLRALVTRLTDVAANLAGELPDPGTEALAAIYCGRNLIYG
jgi:hypothetical protein